MPKLALVGVRLLDGIHPTAAEQTIVIESGRITRVESSASAELGADTEVLELRGKTAMPGMVQAHWHGSYKDLDFEPPPVGLEKPPGYLMLLAYSQARLALTRGFTGVIGAAVGDALDAQLKQAIADGVVDGPRIMPSGRWLITTGDSNDLPEFWWWDIKAPGSQRVCDGADEFRKAARQEIKEGAEIIKLFCDSGHALLYGSDFISMTQAELDAAVEATHQRGKKVRAHVTNKREILRCIAAGVDVLDHVDQIDDECIEAMVDAGTFACPSLYLTRAIIDTLRQQPLEGDQELFVQGLEADYRNMQTMLPKAARAGVKLLVGDDWGTIMTPHGDYHKELELYVAEAGIAPLDVIRWATLHGAECMGMADELGTIEPGKLADIVILDGDPSQDISVLGHPSNPLGVMKEGRWVVSPPR